MSEDHVIVVLDFDEWRADVKSQKMKPYAKTERFCDRCGSSNRWQGSCLVVVMRNSPSNSISNSSKHINSIKDIGVSHNSSRCSNKCSSSNRCNSTSRCSSSKCITSRCSNLLNSVSHK